VVLSVARVTPLVATPEGWNTLAEWSRKLNRQTAQTAEQLFSAVNTPPPSPSGVEPIVYANTPNLGEIGSALPQGSNTVMWVTTSDPPPLMQEYGVPVPNLAVKGPYWRSEIFSTYTGRGWEPAQLAVDPVPPAAPEADPATEAPEGRYYLRQEYDVRARHAGRLFSVSEPVRVDTGQTLRQTAADGSLLLEGYSENYTIVSAATRVSGSQLAQSPVEYPEAIREAYLQLPDALPERVHSLAARITSGAETPFQKAVLIQNYLRANLTYQLNVPPAPDNRDVVDYFLFESPEGFCSHYATSMAVMLRSLDIPARVATGYATGTWDTSRNAYRVTLNSAHAWVEVYFPGYGWVEFEPTVSQAPFEYREDPTWASGSDGLSSPQDAPRTPSRVLLPLLAAVTLVLLAMPLILLRVFRRSQGEPAQQVDALYRQMRKALAWAGLGLDATKTPDEYLAHTGSELASYGRIQQALRRTTALYSQAIYSPRPPQAVDARIANDLWRNAIGEWLVLWVKEKWKKMRA
jgi:transglutaminase-like putative cysteine protease